MSFINPATSPSNACLTFHSSMQIFPRLVDLGAGHFQIALQRLMMPLPSSGNPFNSNKHLSFLASICKPRGRQPCCCQFAPCRLRQMTPAWFVLLNIEHTSCAIACCLCTTSRLLLMGKTSCAHHDYHHHITCMLYRTPAVHSSAQHKV